MRVLDLFSGIGGFSLGLERAGMKTVAFCEYDKKAQLVLKKHWPDVPIFNDIKELTNDILAHTLSTDGRYRPNAEDSSNKDRSSSSVRGESLQSKDRETCSDNFKQGGTHEGVLENTGRTLQQRSQLGGKDENETREGTANQHQRSSETSSIDLICGGFPCQPWSGAGKGKGHTDDRDLWPEMLRVIREVKPRWVLGENVQGFVNKEMGLRRTITDLEGEGYQIRTFIIPACGVKAPHQRYRVWIVGYNHINSFPDEFEITRESMAYSKCQRQQGQGEYEQPCNTEADSQRQASGVDDGSEGWEGHWDIEPNVGRVAHGIPNRVDRLKQLGNSVVPQVVQQVGEAIMKAEYNE